MFFPSSKVIIQHPSDKNKILLVKRHVRGSIYYEPAGGKVEVDFENRIAESLEDCAIREAKEETSLDVKLIKQFHTYSAPDRDPRHHSISTVYIARAKGIPKAKDDALEIGMNAYRKVKTEHTWDKRVEMILKDIGLIE